ncbi:MAG TPA: C25 family cysteine peptidase [Prolixibacteraceae bacterium]|jgi:hypothetical protein
MKYINFIPQWLIFAISVVSPFLVSSQSSNLSFSITGIERVTLTEGVSNYEKVQLKGSFLSHDVGKPCLPVFYYKFYVPKGKVVTGVTYQSTEISQLQLIYDLLPAQHPVLLSQTGKDISFDSPDPAVYGKNALYPQPQATVFRSDFIDGDLEVVTVEFYPMQYNPVQKKVQMTTDGVLSLTTNSTIKLSDTQNHAHGSEFVGLLRSIVENPNDVSSSLQDPVPPIGLKSAQVAWTVPFYEYVVITSRALKPAFAKFISWKKRKGYNAGIVCIEDIVADANAVHSDPISPDNSRTTDDAGKLRAYLTAGFNNTAPKTTYALLGGEPPIVPIRYGWEADYAFNPPLTWANGAAQIPSDLYFSDLQTDWTKGSTDKTGAYYNNGGTDKFDYGAEIYVGRLLCNSESDVMKWSDKVILYEQNPGNGDYSYLSKSLFTEADGLGTISLSALPPIFTTDSVWHEKSGDYDGTATEPHFPKGADVIAELNNHYGFYSVFNHGSSCSFATATYGTNGYEVPGTTPHRYQVTSSDSYIDNYNITPENGNGFDNLTNFNFPTIIYSISCINMPYDNYDYWGVNHKMADGTRTLGTSFTVTNSGGGPAYLGNTRDGWSGTANTLETIFFNYISSFPQLGIAEAKSKIGFYDHWTCLTHNLLGCPETPMWTVAPTIFNATVSENGSSVTVNTGGVVADKICVMSALNDGYFQVQPNVSSFTFSGVSKPYYVTITKANYIPFRNTLTNVYVQNKNLSSTAYLNCQTVSAGYNVDASQSVGNVVIQSGADITFDATGDIVLASGFEVQLGATFEAK